MIESALFFIGAALFFIAAQLGLHNKSEIFYIYYTVIGALLLAAALRAAISAWFI